MSQFREAIDRFDIAAWAERNGVEIQVHGRKNVYARCMVCDGNKKLSISKEKKIVRCFKCEAGHGRGVWEGRADLLRFIMIVLGCSRGRAINELFSNVGPLPTSLPIGEELDLQLPPEAMLIGTACHADHPCRLYLDRRGLGRFAGTWFMCPTGRYAGRIIIPVRAFDEEWGYDAKTFIGGEPKSLANLREGAVYLSERWDHTRNYAVITESPMDAESIGLNAVGLFGSALDENRLSTLLQLRRYGVTDLIWFFDGDAFEKQWRTIRKWMTLYFRNKRIRCPADQDPNSLSFIERWQLIAGAKQVDSSLDIVADILEAA